MATKRKPQERNWISSNSNKNNTMRTNYIKIDNTQQNSNCRLCGERDETVNHIISECSILAQKEYKNRHDWVGKVIHWELCKRLKFDYNTKCYKHKLESILENEMHKIPWNFETQTDCLILTRRQDPELITPPKKRKFAILLILPF